ncbi:MAG: hypothetical protein GX975_02290 [Clostridiales bacterium]|mgnify:CR=1 FL=1|nr:hypothetical protein [Clostridiales bacterium]
MSIKRIAALLLASIMIVSLGACKKAPEERPVEYIEGEIIQIFAPIQAAGLISSLAYTYTSEYEGVQFLITNDDGELLAAKIEAGYTCDIYIADEKSFMDWLDINCDEELNPNRNDKIVKGSRREIMTGPGNPDYCDEELAEDEVYISSYSAAVCVSSGKPYESQCFIDFLSSETAKKVMEEFGYTPIDNQE